MPKRITKLTDSHDEFRFGQHRFEHWQVDNQVYFLTARCRARFPAFASESAKKIFWDRFEFYTAKHGFVPWVTSLLDNHYHTVGYLREGKQLGIMMQRLHGSVAKMVNDVLREQEVEAPWMRCGPGGEPPSAKIGFWGDYHARSYFDGCLRDAKQGRLTWRYVHTQCRRHGICDDPADYLHTRVNVERERAIERAVALKAFMEGVPYARYAKGARRDGSGTGR